MAENVVEIGEYLMMKKILLKPENEEIDPMQRKVLFACLRGNVAKWS